MTTVGTTREIIAAMEAAFAPHTTCEDPHYYVLVAGVYEAIRAENKCPAGMSISLLPAETQLGEEAEECFKRLCIWFGMPVPKA